MFKKLASVVALSAAIVVPAFAVDSGLNVGERITPLHPAHATGPHAGSEACPPCSNGQMGQTIVFVNGDDMDNVKKIAGTLDRAMRRNAEFRGYVVVIAPSSELDATKTALRGVASQTGFDKVGMAVMADDARYLTEWKVNLDSEVKNTVFVYKNWEVADKFVNLKGDAAGVAKLNAAISKVA